MSSTDATNASRAEATGVDPDLVILEEDTHVLEALLNDDHPRKRAASIWAADNLYDPQLVERDHECTFWHEGWERLAAKGMLGLLAPTEHGGADLDLCSALLTIEGLGHGCRDDGLIFAMSSQVLTMQLTLQRFGSTEQVSTWLPRLLTGEAFGAFCMTEPESGSDAYSLTTAATPVTDGYQLDGEKAWITMAPLADVFIVFATVNPELGRWGITAFLVPADTPGLTVGNNRPKSGMRTTPFANVVLDGCVVPESARIGSEGAGASIFSAAMEAERGFLLAGGVGALERVLDDAVDYARNREQFGQPIGTFQGVSHPIADIKLAHESARLLLYKAAALQQRGNGSMMAAALAKLGASEAVLSGALTSLEVHGARGYVTEFEVEREVRNALGGVIYGGASAIQKNIIARLLGLPG
jgi:alkylation response protein AidB-like acyl-CoA dehydrogenase